MLYEQVLIQSIQRIRQRLNRLRFTLPVEFLLNPMDLHGFTGLLPSIGTHFWMGFLFLSGANLTICTASQMYQYQLSNASNVFMGLMQTETPYYQPLPAANLPFAPNSVGAFVSDPNFADCSAANCESAWALRILGSSHVFIYGAGFYSFFSDYDQACNMDETCQQRLIQTSCSSDVWMFNLATKGAVEVVSPAGGLVSTYQDDNQR